MKNKKETRGGTRLNSGAKPKYNEPTTTMAFRVPISKVSEIRELVKGTLSKWVVTKTAKQ